MATCKRSNASRKSQFFKVLLPPCLEMLRIPPKFAVQHLNDNNMHIHVPRKATILSPLGKFWHVDLLKEGSDLFFRGGWKEFVRAHRLLEYRDGDLEADLNCSVPATTKQTTEPSSSKKRKNETPAEEIFNLPKKCSKKTLPHFVKMIKPYNLRRYMIVPDDFCLENGLLTTREMILMRDSKQRSWPIRFGVSATGNILGKGWIKFCAQNNLKGGERCIFELVEENVLRFQLLKS
ncbi:putative B3 domain-containing protein Os04g0347400 isoform X2 [Typha angustifolia]|uniref:putative B3 domain-containing protein Os04g0347400 isoform X2 n=1 Tax=Typha angustifolia TaxID=59011 RepID=UPI003C2F7D0F